MGLSVIMGISDLLVRYEVKRYADEVKRYEDEVNRYEDEVPGSPPPRAAHARALRAFQPQPSICARLPLR